MLGAVVPLVRAGDPIVDELMPDRIPRRAPVVRALNQLPEPSVGLRRIQPIGVDGRALEVVDLPAPKVRATDIPLIAFAIRCQDERALACANQDPYLTHLPFLPAFPEMHVRRARVPRPLVERTGVTSLSRGYPAAHFSEALLLRRGIPVSPARHDSPKVLGSQYPVVALARDAGSHALSL